MFNRAVAGFLKPFLEQYFKDFDSSRIEIEILNGKVHLTDLNIKEDCLIHHQIPFYIKHGLINSLFLTISSEKCEVDINNIFIDGSEVFNSTFVPNNFFNKPKSIILNYIFPIIQSVLNIFFDSSLDSLRKLFDNLTVKIKKIHIRFEGLMNKKQSFGIIIKSVDLYSIDQEGEKIYVKNHPPSFLKKILFDHFALYFDTESVEINSNEFEQQMLIQMNSKHNYILSPFSFSCIFNYSTESNTVTNLDILINKINLFLNMKQIAALKKLSENFKIQRDYNHLDRPSQHVRPCKPIRSDRSASIWWYYSYKCIAFRKNKKQPLNIQKAIDVLKNRNIFFQTWRKFIVNTERHKKEYNDLINSLDSNTLALLRFYSSFVISKEIGNSSVEIDESEIIRFFKEPKKVNPFKFNVVLEEELIIGIKDDSDKEIFTLEFRGFNVNGEKSQDLNSPSQKINYSIAFKADSICVNNGLSERYHKMIEIPNGIGGSINFNNIDPTHISLNISSFSFIFDIEWFSNLMNVLGEMNTFLNIEFKNKNKENEQEQIDSHPKAIFDLKIENINILIPYQEIEEDQPIFQISLDSFDVHSKPSIKYDINKIDSLFDDYEISINSLQMFLNETKISNEININSLIKCAIISLKDTDAIKVNCIIQPINLRLTFFQVLLLNELCSYILDKLNTESIKKLNLVSYLSPNFSICVDVNPITIFLMYEDQKELMNTESFKIQLNDHTSINISRKNYNLTVFVTNNSGIECFEFFTSNAGKFLTTKKFDLTVTSINPKTSIELNIDGAEVYAKAVPLNFLIVLSQFPKCFEWMLHLKEESTISKYLHVSKKRPELSDVNVNIKLNKTRLHLIEFDIKKDDKSVTVEENEILFLSTNQILVSVNNEQNKNEIKIEIDPPQAQSVQFGPIWTDIISKKDNPPSPIVINLTPTSVTFDIDNFQANIAPLLLLKIIKFVLIVKNPYAHLHNDPNTVIFLKLNINIHKTIIKIIHDIDSSNYYELNVTDFKFNTVKAPMDHQIQCNNIQIIQKIQNRIDNILFEIKNMNFILGMKCLIRDNIDQIKPKSFNELLDERGLENWSERTINFINENENEEKILSQSFFYFHALSLKIEIDELSCIYSHEFARNISTLASHLIKTLKNDSFFDYKNHQFQSFSNHLDIVVDFKVAKGSFSIVDQSYLLLAKLNLDSINLEIDPTKWIYNASINKIILNSENEEEKILETGPLLVETIDKDIYINLESLCLYIKLKYWPDGVYYIMNCPLFSFVDEFEENIQKQTSFEMKMGLFFSLDDFKVTLPIQEDLIHLKSSFYVSLTPDGNIAQVNDVHMLLNDKLIMKQFSILFGDNSWDVDPILIKFSVFDVHIIDSLIKEINSLTMPQIYVFKKEAEMNKRKYSVNLKRIDIVLTQPNLPFVSLEIKPSTFKQSYSNTNENEKILEYNVELLLKHENYLNHGTDIIIDPFKVSVKSSIINHKSSTKAEVSPINIALSSSFLSEIFQFKKKYSLYKKSNYDSKAFEERIIYIQNDTLQPATIYLLKQNSHEEIFFELSDSNPISLNEYDLKSKIKINIEGKTIEFLIKDLFSPIFYDKTIVVYLAAEFGVQTIHLSSPYIIKNCLYYDIDVLIDNKYMGIVQRGKERPIPIILLQFLSKGISATNNPASRPSSTMNIMNNKQQIYKFYNDQNKMKFYSSVCVSTDPQRSLRIISFLPYITFENRLPIQINVSFLSYEIDYDLKPGKKFDVSYLKDKILKLRIKIRIEPFGESDDTEITTYDKKPNPIRISINRGKETKCRIAFMCVYDDKTDTYNNIIFAPCVLYNETNVPLLIKGSSKMYYPFINKMCIYTPKEFIHPGPFKSSNIPLRIKLQDMTEINLNEIDCLQIKTKEKLSLPFIDNNELYCQISAVKKPSKFENTTNLVLKIHFTIFNHLDSNILLIPSNVKVNDYESILSNNYRICCRSKEKSMIVHSNLEGKFAFCIEKYEVCNEVNLINQTTTVFRLINKMKNESDIMIQLDVIEVEEGFFAHFSYATFPSPLVITNMLSNSIIRVDQKSDKNKQYPMFIERQSTSLFAKTQPFIEKDTVYEHFVDIAILQQEKQISFSVHYSNDIPSQKIKETNYLYEVITTQKGDKMILVKDQDNENENEQNLNKSSKNMVLVEMPFISIYLSKIEISFIDKLMRELCLLCIKNINLIHKKQESTTFTIESFRLNDMNVDSNSPVVFCEKSPRFLSVEFKSKLPLKSHYFDSIDISISPLHVFVDIVFISDLLYAIYEVINDSKIPNECEKEQKNNEKYDIYSFYRIKSISISPLSIDFSKINSISRENRLPRPDILPSIVMIIKYIVIPASMNKYFERYQNKNIHAPLSNFIKSIYNNYSNQVSKSDIKSISLFKDSSAFKVSSESFDDLMENSDDLKRYKKKGLIAKPERIPRAFPMNRITSVLMNNENDKKFCQFSMAQYTFQNGSNPKHPNECLLLLIRSENVDGGENSFLAIFNHFVVHLSDNLQVIKNVLRVAKISKIDRNRKTVKLTERKNKIRFKCESEDESKLIVNIVKSIADKIDIFEN